MHLSMVWRGESGADQSTEHIDEPQRQSAFKKQSSLITYSAWFCLRALLAVHSRLVALDEALHQTGSHG